MILICKKELPEKVGLEHTLKFGISCYESGMIEVLRGIALESLDYGMVNIPMTQYTKKHRGETEEKYKKLYNAVDGPFRDLLVEYEEMVQTSSSFNASDHFIEGFIRGYGYLKHQVAYGNYNTVREDKVNAEFTSD